MTPRARVLVVALAIFFIVCAGAVFLIVRKALDNTSFTALNKTACELLTLEEAKTLLDDTVKRGKDSPSIKETPNLKTTQCSYATQGKSVQDMHTIELEVRAAKTDAGAVQNASQFSPHNMNDQQIPGYGDAALWDPLAGQLSVLKDGNFYSVSMSKGLGAGKVKLNEVQTAAAIIGLKD